MSSDIAVTSPGGILTAPTDPDEFLQAAMEWHFSPSTGSPFWLERARRLDFDPRKDIKTFDDLSLFPNFANDLRDVRVEDLVPKGYGPTVEVIGVFESGGTTGPSKRVIVLRDWIDQVLGWLMKTLDDCGVPRGENWLAIVPSGPHMVGDLWRRVATARDGLWLSIDLDPRWVKKLVSEQRFGEVEAYTEHLIDQAEMLIESQDAGVLMTTPPVLDRICRRERFVDAIHQHVKSIQWGGAHMDSDSRQLYMEEVFPDVRIAGGYANTMALGAGGMERLGIAPTEACVFDAFSPFVSFSVVEPESEAKVPYGSRGQVVVSHCSRSFFLPNNRERDLATRVEAPAGYVGDSLADIEPVRQFEGAEVIEGVY